MRTIDLNKKIHRIFSMNMYKNLKLSLGKLTLTNDFVNDKRGNLYPIINKSEDCIEYIKENRHCVEKGTVERFIGQFFPYATYEISFDQLNGKVGFIFNTKTLKASLIYDGSMVEFTDGDKVEKYNLSEKIDTIIVSCRPCAFDLYSFKNDSAYFIHTFTSEMFEKSDKYEEFSTGYVSFAASGVKITSGSFYIDCGISQADIRPIRYEDGTAIHENGKIFFTVSIRMQARTFQGVFSWVAGTAEFELIGALFFDSGDGRWCGDVATSLIYNRPTDEWYLWVASFSHGHILGHASFKGEPRFGVNVIDIELMKESDNDNIFMHNGYPGDEDPDMIYVKEVGKWYMAICRKDPKIKAYRYVFFESDKPFENYKYIGCGNDGNETGGSFVKINDQWHFVCGNSFEATSDYRIYNEDGMYNPSFDFCDGGFRGWGTIVPIQMGTRTRYFWLTFDRHNGSDYNWSYGNLYCFELLYL